MDMRIWRPTAGDAALDDLTIDVAIASGLLVLALVEVWLGRPSPHVTGLTLLVLLYTVPLALRRRFPRSVLFVVISCGPTLTSTVKAGGLISYVLAALLASYTVGRQCPRPATWWAPVLILGEGWTYFTVVHGQLSDYVYIALLYGGSWAVGLALRERTSRAEVFARDAAAAREHTAERTRQAVADERRRIARELHDLVSHSLSVIAIQTEVIRLELPAEQTRARNGLVGVEAAARQALAEMRRLLGMLRDEGETAERQPTPGITQLPGLLTDHDRTGPPVEVQVVGERRPLPGGVDLAAYRIIQESLTNVRKHSATTGTVRLRIAYGPDEVEIIVLDPGPPRSDPPASRGQGLIGMRERVALYAGSLVAGPDDSDGWRVAARLPAPSQTCP